MIHTMRRRPQRSSLSTKPCVEALEDRNLLSANVLQTNLVSDLAGVAQFQDPHLVNPWGISESASTPTRPGSPFWIADNNAGVSTLYNTAGVPQSLVVSIPTPGDPLGASGTPTGTVFNVDGGALGGFKVSGVDKNGNPTTAPAIFLFATEDGTLVGWNPGVNPKGFDPTKAGTYAIIAVDNSGNNFTNPDPNQQTGAVYKGMTIATSATPIIASDPNSTALLYASNFRAGTIDVYDAAFHKVTSLPAGAFTDPKLPHGYAPFNVEVLGGKIYVTYAKQNAAKHDDVAGEGKGFVDVYNLDGTGEKRLISRGELNAPWGLALAPASFGNLAGSLLVGNFGDGRIHAYDAATGAFKDTLKDPDGEAIQIDGLWALKVGNGGNGGNANTVYFTAGLDHEQHGLFGSLAAVAPGTPEGLAEAQAVQANLDVFQIDLNIVLKDISTGVTGATLKQDLQNLNTAFFDLVRSEIHFARDSAADAGSSHTALKAEIEALDDLFADLSSLTHWRF
jgi:uncharacterized protein (TIGR03118 family)